MIWFFAEDPKGGEGAQQAVKRLSFRIRCGREILARKRPIFQEVRDAQDRRDMDRLCDTKPV